MNKAKQAILISTMVAWGLFSKFNNAIAKTLNANDKNNFQTEELFKFTDKTSNLISINLDQQNNTNSPDSTEIRNFFVNWDVLTDEEKVEFNMMRDRASNTGVRQFYEWSINTIFVWSRTDEEKAMFIVAILDPEQTTNLWQKSKEKIKEQFIYTYMYSQIEKEVQLNIDGFLLDESIKEKKEITKKLDEEWKKLDESIKEKKEITKKLDEEWKKLDEEWKKLDEEWKKLDEEWKKLDILLKTLEEMEKVFKEHQQKE